MTETELQHGQPAGVRAKVSMVASMVLMLIPQ